MIRHLDAKTVCVSLTGQLNVDCVLPGRQVLKPKFAEPIRRWARSPRTAEVIILRKSVTHVGQRLSRFTVDDPSAHGEGRFLAADNYVDVLRFTTFRNFDYGRLRFVSNGGEIRLFVSKSAAASKAQPICGGSG